MSPRNNAIAMRRYEALALALEGAHAAALAFLAAPQRAREDVELADMRDDVNGMVWQLDLFRSIVHSDLPAVDSLRLFAPAGPSRKRQTAGA